MSGNPAIPNHWQSVRDHSRAWEEFLLVYPVVSRRSGGLSIGVNLNPDKRCNFDCVYCEVDRHTPPRILKADPDRIRTELAAMIRAARSGELARHPRFRETGDLTRRIRDIAFSGDGEPTMVPNFAKCVRAAAEVKEAEGLHDTKLVLITDAAGLDKADVRRGLEILDAHQGEVWAKLDAGTEDYYRRVNRSHVRFDRILRNLLLTARQRPILIQTLFLKLHGQPMPPEELEAYCRRLCDILDQGGRIGEVQAYTIARPTPEPWATRLEPSELETFAEVIRQRTGLPVSVYP
ncbi:MAG: radical SAM protein [Verrucomicrobia bacterium]|nr:MAG: radical SAM protein [Verrucomicrobiota bacterium]